MVQQAQNLINTAAKSAFVRTKLHTTDDELTTLNTENLAEERTIIEELRTFQLILRRSTNT